MYATVKGPLVVYCEGSSPGEPADEPAPGWDLNEAIAQQLAPDKGPQDKKDFYKDSFSDVASISPQSFVVGERSSHAAGFCYPKG